MIQYYRDLSSQVKTIQSIDLSGGQIQKLYSTATLVSISIRVPGKTWSLYLGRGSGVEGVWIGAFTPPSVLRKKDNFLEYLRRHLSSCTFIGVELDQHDRIVKLDYQKFGHRQSLLLLWKARKVYFAHVFRDSPEGQLKVLLSWKNRPSVLSDDVDLFSLFDEVGRRTDMQHEFKSNEPKTVEDLLKSEEAMVVSKSAKFKPDFLQRKKQKIEDDLNRANQWKDIQDFIASETSIESMYEVQIRDHKIKFQSGLNQYERRSLLFEKIKKLKKGSTILGQRLEQVNEALEERKKPQIMDSGIPITRIAWGEEKTANQVVAHKTEEKLDFNVFKGENWQIGVGNSARGNDQLRSKWAGKEDLWLHLDGLKSAHAILKMNQGHPGNNEINLAASILAHFSHFKGEWIPVIYTPVKNLRGVSGIPGMVTYKKEKHLTCQLLDVSSLIEGK